MEEASAAKLEELRLAGQGVAQLFFVGNVSSSASRSGCCGWCEDTFRRELAACSRAAQLVDESLGTLHGGWVQPKMCFDMSCFCDRICMFVTWCNVVG